jgi:ubiquinone/menaquinone biosynthesis C-methylase UbiE
MCLVLLDGKLHLAPIENPQNVLDVGTGTGIWAVEFGNLELLCKEQHQLTQLANQYPSAKVTGTDLSPIQPTL